MMELNLTLLGQMLTFAIFVWFTMRFVWPPIKKALDDRKEKIADGLAAAERGKHDLELAQHKAMEMLREAKIKAGHIVEESHKRASQIIEAATQQARQDAEHLLELAKSDVEREFSKAQQELKKQTVSLAMAMVKKVLGKQMNEAVNNDLLTKLITEEIR
jgi:F-type H+-transporting ATPase subunit b